MLVMCNMHACKSRSSISLTPVISGIASVTESVVSTLVTDDTYILTVGTTMNSDPTMATVKQGWLRPSTLQIVHVNGSSGSTIELRCTMLHSHCSCKPKLLAGNISITETKSSSTNCSPASVVQHFQSSLIVGSSSSQSHKTTIARYIIVNNKS